MWVTVLPISPWRLLRLREGEPPPPPPLPRGGSAHVATVGKVVDHAASRGREVGEQGCRQVQSLLLEPQDGHLMQLLGESPCLELGDGFGEDGIPRWPTLSVPTEVVQRYLTSWNPFLIMAVVMGGGRKVGQT